MIVNKHLDKSTLFNKENINESETKRDQFVWDTATKIYQQSGHKVELSLVRDIVDSRIRAIKNQIAEEARLIAAAEAEKAQQFLSKVTDVLGKFGGDERKAKVFVRVRELISEQLSVEEREVTLDSHLSNHLNADEFDVGEIMMALEEEFDIEIPNEVAEKSLGISINIFSGGSWSWWSSSSSSPSSFIYQAGEQCIVRNFVEVICEVCEELK
ncbi:acyl carrier protein [Aphanizomenon flos-aquae FACHB-1416]|uniref:Acyl carrier protein n=2 Tax=Aphanizomenonaceae TaxID=1892259 RepID=A0ABR8IND6_APHFL|nr:acyl carrier protein [Aphanizomenon flos-aquae FACHB-1171]MBD2557182.1 acyl carrier protein [Aphanizomenon flos-aquae FACHB-1290]MBD2630596.1 acyl carrier protein [Aphanizomenon sp. FACHB-1399]MBD2641503.1 acyl carrier protein [Aphanizomenon sp. FACHB-1401]MBD2656881.1 acyl carrier protein [Aphanizomenon flos-aquae FACHB-1265]MBD2673776.1 acyl carrier protein [Aphanizomenon flos-aquae FACHB-1416]MBD2684427.1 acyl carrier protein [Aphanizomenon flos-aquae FACHB-1249]MBD2696450.1 acyl carri